MTAADVRFRTEATPSTQSICAKAAPWLNENQGPEVVAVVTILTAFATIAFILRVIARKLTKLNFGADDWLIALALVSSTQYHLSSVG